VRRRVIVGAFFFDDVFVLTVGSVRATSLRKRSSVNEAVCFAFTNERSIAARLAGISGALLRAEVVANAETFIPPIGVYLQ
jgi:hypothetical protein